MTDKIKKILDDLYALDPKLKDHEKAVVKLVEELLSSRPDAEVDPDFSRKLLAELKERIGEIKASRVKGIFGWSHNYRYLRTFGYVAATAVLVFFITVSFEGKPLPQPAGTGNEGSVFDFELNIEKVGEGSFGKLSYSAASDGVAQAKGMGGGGGMLSSSESVPAPMVGMIAPQWYKYVYKGNGFSIPEAEMEVLKKVRKSYSPSSAGNIADSFNIDMMDLKSFEALGIQNISFAQDKDLGYMVTIDLLNGTANIGENWEKWYNDVCQTPECYEAKRVKFEDVPSDEEMIGAANDFAREHKLDLGSYGEPSVDDEWRTSYKDAEDKDNAYVPEIIQIKYPLMIDGKVVYDQWGNITGIYAGYSVRERMIANFGGFTALNFQASLYETEQDEYAIIDIAEKGGLNGYAGATDENVIEIELGEPSLQYSSIYNYNGGRSEELIVPALVFPVVDIPEEARYLNRKSVVVPIIKDILKNDDNGGRIMPMPLIEPAMVKEAVVSGPETTAPLEE